MQLRNIIFLQKKMEKPIEPSKDDCCNSGCNPCIFDIYEKQLKAYKRYLEHGVKDTDNLLENGISQLKYTKFITIRNVNLCPSHNLITFKKATLDGNKVFWKPGDHFLFKYISDKKSCTRAYTPVTLHSESEDDNDFSIIVKKYNNGLVSPHLYSMEEGCVALWRGPYGNFEIKPNKYEQIIMIAQGTGIAPFVKIIDNILNNEDDMTKVLLLYCSKSIDTILFRDELYAYKSYWNFEYEIYTCTPSCSKSKYKEPIKNCKMSIADVCNFKPFAGNSQFLICGSQQFNDYYSKYIRTKISQQKNLILF